MHTNRINHSSESDDTNAGGAEMFFLFLYVRQNDSEQLLTESPGTIERYVAYVQDGETRAMYVTNANDIMAVQSSNNIVPEKLEELMSMAEDGTISAVDYAEGEGAFDGTGKYCAGGDSGRDKGRNKGYRLYIQPWYQSGKNRFFILWG